MGAMSEAGNYMSESARTNEQPLARPWPSKYPQHGNRPETAVFGAGMRYFFDSRDNGTFIPDEVGLMFADFEDVRYEAARALAEIAKDELPGSERRRLAIEVRDEMDHRVLVTTIIFEVRVLI
jgi:hypothetical protein